MAIRKIVKYGDPVLRRRCQPVESIDREVRKLIGDMFETMYDAPGVGLAANQVGVSLALAVIDIQAEGRQSPIVLINPRITELSGQLKEEEGCLSIPGFLAPIKRFASAKVSALNEKGLPVVITGEGLLARALQHETDHLHGKLYVDHLSFVKRVRMFSLIKRSARSERWNA